MSNHTMTVLPNCAVCNGTGFDSDFNSPCNCVLFNSPSLRAQAIRNMLGDDGRTAPVLTSGGTGSGVKTDKANKYAGLCGVCNVRVEAGAGWIIRVGNGWGVRHSIGECPTVAPAVQAAVQAAQAPSVRRNAHPGKCVRCGVTVAAQAGLLNKSDGRWVVSHDGECPAAPVTGLDLSSLPQTSEVTYFAVPTGETRLKVRVNRPTAGKWAGYIFVDDGAEYGYGRRYGRQAPGQAYVGEIVPELAAIVADPFGALKRYAEITSRCGICNRPLEDEVSVARGIGPVCWGKIS